MINFIVVNFDRRQTSGRTDEVFSGAEFHKHVAPCANISVANISVANFVALVCFGPASSHFLLSSSFWASVHNFACLLLVS